MNTEHFQVIIENNHVIVQCREGFVSGYDDELVGLLEVLDENFTDHPAPPLLFMKLKEINDLNAAILGKMAKIASSLKRKGQRIFLIGGTARTKTAIVMSGLDGLLHPVANVEEALDFLGVPTPTKVAKPIELNADFINPFIGGVQLVLKRLCDLDAKMQKPLIKKKGYPLQFEVAAAVQMKSRGLNGAIVLGFEKPVLLEITSRWLKQKFTDLDPKQLDGAAELLNMITGQGKAAFYSKTNQEIHLKIPRPIKSPALLIDAAAGHSSMVIPFSTKWGSFWLQIVTVKDPTALAKYQKLFDEP